MATTRKRKDGKSQGAVDQPSDVTAKLVAHLLAIELWRSGLSQKQIRLRLGLAMNEVSRMLKGVSKEIQVHVRRTTASE